MSDEAPPRPRARKPPMRGHIVLPKSALPAPSGGQSFQLLSFPKPEAIVKPQPQVLAILEEWRSRALAGRVVALGLVAVTDEGQMMVRTAHNQPTVSGLLTGARLLEETLVRALMTVYAAPPGTGQPAVKPENEVPE